jgi:hypothetical protein
MLEKNYSGMLKKGKAIIGDLRLKINRTLRKVNGE